ncbi:MAG: hypothetical protein WCG63_07685 [Opitutaceae bacterium]
MPFRILLCLLVISFGRVAYAANPVPNFIFTLADDLGWTSLSSAMDDHLAGSRSDSKRHPPSRV